jgi:hypothetical protein
MTQLNHGFIGWTGRAGSGVEGLHTWMMCGQLNELLQELETQGVLNHKALEKKRGFFNHLQRTYPAIMPFLKGFHLTLDGW